MEAYKEAIEHRYRAIARFPEWMLSFTNAIRRDAVALLHLTSGSSVVDVGCGTGASFPYLEAAIGQSGRILGIEPSRSMITGARDRVQRAGWRNIVLRENMVEEVEGHEEYDGALLFAMHDVFNSIEGLQKIHSLLKVGALIVCVGPKIQEKGPLRILNPMLHLLFKRMAFSQDNKDRPWLLVEEAFETDQIIEAKHGLIFLYVGHKTRLPG